MYTFEKKINFRRIRSNQQNYRNTFRVENNITLFQIHTVTDVACKYPKPLFKTQYSELFFRL